MEWDARLQQLIEAKDPVGSMYGEGWAIIDGALVIYNGYDAPSWLALVLSNRDEDGNTGVSRVKVWE